MSEARFWLPVLLRERLHELTGSEFKVWFCYRARMSEDGLAWPGRDLLSADTGLSDEETISACRSGLTRKGWLLPGGTQRTKGRFDVPMFRPVIPDRDGFSPSRETTVTVNARHGKDPVHRSGKNPLIRRTIEEERAELENAPLPTPPSKGKKQKRGTGVPEDFCPPKSITPSPASWGLTSPPNCRSSPTITPRAARC